LDQIVKLGGRSQFYGTEQRYSAAKRLGSAQMISLQTGTFLTESTHAWQASGYMQP
jgi:hypothetical protein